MLAPRPTNFGREGSRCQQGWASHLVDSTTSPFAGALSQITHSTVPTRYKVRLELSRGLLSNYGNFSIKNLCA
jgi:hypothetical protein